MKLEEGLRQRPMAPEMVEEFVAAYSEEVNRHRREATAARAGKERALAEVRRKLDKLIEALIEGYRAPGLQQKLEELEARKAALEQELTADPPPPVRLHPNLAQVYRGKVGRLHEALADAGLRDEALGILRGLLERVAIHPGEDGLQGGDRGRDRDDGRAGPGRQTGRAPCGGGLFGQGGCGGSQPPLPNCYGVGSAVATSIAGDSICLSYERSSRRLLAGIRSVVSLGVV